jgi:hypothetical protein
MIPALKSWATIKSSLNVTISSKTAIAADAVPAVLHHSDAGAGSRLYSTRRLRVLCGNLYSGNYFAELAGASLKIKKS